MPHHESNPTALVEVLELLTEQGFDGLSNAMQILLNEAMKLERAEFIGAAPHERSTSRRGWANGFKSKHLATRVGEIELDVPQVRGVPDGQEGFYPKSLTRGLRSERALKLAIAEMYIQGVSTRRVTAVVSELCGLDVSSAQVSRAAAALDDELKAWRTRELGRCKYLILDARYEKVRHGGSVVSCAVLSAIGVRSDGKRSVLGVSVALSEAEVHWRDFLASLMQRKLHGIELIVSDDHQGLKAALRACLPSVPWQRCQFHLQRNAIAYVPRTAMRRDVADVLRGIFNAPDRAEADRRLAIGVAGFRESAPKLAEWMEHNIPEGLTVFALPSAHRRLLRTSNVLERLNQEIKRRTRVATLFPNEASLLRLVSAVLAEISDDWETGRIYLTLENG
jgi:transposase-like protein